MAGAGGDPFGTQALRDAVLGAWRGSPTRFREDANAEEDLARGGYRDRLVVELAQNAADAAVRAGQPGRLLLRLRDGVLEASNTGAPLTAAGAASLAALRASAKRDDAGSVGRFGVGFAAVLAVCDAPAVRSLDGGVRFSAADARALVGTDPALADELTRRAGQLPVLRLPFPEPTPPERGFATTVVLPLRDPTAVALVHELLAAVDDALLLGLTGLAEVVVDAAAHRRRRLSAHREGGDVVVDDDGRTRRWRVSTTHGRAPDGLLADRPVEERARPGWSVTWAVPLADDGQPRALPEPVAPVLHAPTPTDEPLGLPALLLASFPLDPSRRHVAPGRLTDFLVDRCADGYAELAAGLALDGPGVLRLVPDPAPSGPLDGRLREAVLARLRVSLRLPVAHPPGRRLPVAETTVLDPPVAPVVQALGPVVDGLVDAAWATGLPVLDRLGVPRLPLADALDALADAPRPPAWWRQLYDALSGVEPVLLEGLPVPLVDGRTVRGPRAVLLPGAEVPPEDLAVLGHRIAHPDAVHPLLGRLGAAQADPARLLADRQLLARLPDADEALVEAVLRTVAAAGVRPGEGAALGRLPLACRDGQARPASGLVLPGSPLAAAAGPDVHVVSEALVAAVGSQPLLAVGVLDRLRVRRLVDVEADPDALGEVDPGLAEWAEEVLDAVAAAGGAVELPPLLGEVPVVLGLQHVDDPAWPQALPLLADPDVHRAVTTPVRAQPVAGPAVAVPAPAAWWLREAPLLDGVAPTRCRLGDAEPVLAALYPHVAASAHLDVALLRAVGVRWSVAALLAEPEGPAELVERLADPAAQVPADDVVALYRALAALPEDRWPDPPDAVRVPRGAGSVVVPAPAVVVVVAPHHLALVGPDVLAGDHALAALLDVDDTDRLAVLDPAGGLTAPVPAAVAAVLAAAPTSYQEHDELLVDGRPVEWWVGPDGVVHAATAHGLSRGLAWACGAWDRRFEVAELLADPARAAELAAERAFDPGVDRTASAASAGPGAGW